MDECRGKESPIHKHTHCVSISGALLQVACSSVRRSLVSQTFVTFRWLKIQRQLCASVCVAVRYTRHRSRYPAAPAPVPAPAVGLSE